MNDPRKAASKMASSQETTVAQLGLRFDRVALEVLEDLRVFSGKTFSSNQVVLFVMTAPIRLSAKTVSEIEKKLVGLLKNKKTSAKFSAFGNQIQIRIVEGKSTQRTRFFGLVHNPSTQAKRLLNMMEEELSTLRAV